MSGKRKFAKKKTGKRCNSNRIERIKRKQANDASVSKRSTTITDLNDHCIATIFSHLNIIDLANVAASNTRFSVSPRLAFKINFSKEVVYISNEHHRKAKMILRKFGFLIEELSLKYDAKYHRFNYALEATISKYCHKTLNRMNVSGYNEALFNRIKRTFEAVGKISFCEGVLGEFQMNLRKWFPNLRLMNLILSKIENANYAKCIEQNIPSLKSLNVSNDSESPIYFTNENLKRAIQMNQCWNYLT